MKLIRDTISYSEDDRQKSRVCEEEPPGRCHKKPHEEITQNIIFKKMKNPVEPEDVRIKFRDPGEGREKEDGSCIKEGRQHIEKKSLCGEPFHVRKGYDDHLTVSPVCSLSSCSFLILANRGPSSLHIQQLSFSRSGSNSGARTPFVPSRLRL